MDFDDIPKEALVPSRSIAQNDKDKARAGPDPDSVFGLPGDAVRFVKKGTYATLALMVLALVVVRSPLMNIIAPDAGKLELAKKAEREALDKQGKALPGVRPFPSLQLTPEEEVASGGSAVKVVDDATLGKSEGLEINIGGGQKIKMGMTASLGPVCSPRCLSAAKTTDWICLDCMMQCRKSPLRHPVRRRLMRRNQWMPTLLPTRNEGQQRKVGVRNHVLMRPFQLSGSLEVARGTQQKTTKELSKKAYASYVR